MAIGTSTGEEFPSKLEEVLSNMDKSASVEPSGQNPIDDGRVIRNKAYDQFRDENEIDINSPATEMRRKTRVAGDIPTPDTVEPDLTTKLRQRFGNPPPAARMFVDTVLGNTNKITESDFTSEEINHLRAVADKQLNLGKKVIGYGDYNPEEKGGKYEKSFELGKGGSQMFMDALTDLPSSLSFTLGMAQVKREEDGTIVIKDRYHWAAPEAKVQELKDQGSWAVLKKVGEGLRDNGLLGVGNVIGNLVAPKEGGRDVEIRIPPGDASIPKNAKTNAAEFTPDSTWAAMVDSFSNPDSKVPSAEKMVQGNYSKVVDWLTENGKTPGQEMQNWSTKEKLGYMLSTAMGLVGAGRNPRAGGDAILSGRSGIGPAKAGRAENDNYPDTREFSNLRMSASEMKDYLADRAKRPSLTPEEVNKMISTWENANTPPNAYERALANQKAGRMNPTGDSVEDFIKGSKKSTLRLVTENPEQPQQGRPVPSLQQRQTQEAQRAANDRNYQMGKGTERVNVGPGRGVLNDNKEEVMALISKGASPSEVAKKYDITPMAVRNWIKRNGRINTIEDILKPKD